MPTATGAPRKRVIFSALMLVVLLAALDQSIVSTALPTIVGDLGGLTHLSWVVTEITDAPEFYEAEDYHQQYLEKRGRATCTPALQRTA